MSALVFVLFAWIFVIPVLVVVLSALAARARRRHDNLGHSPAKVISLERVRRSRRVAEQPDLAGGRRFLRPSIGIRARRAP